MAQHTQLILTLVHSLSSSNYLRCDLAAKLLLMICVEPGFRKEQVRRNGCGSLLTVRTCSCEPEPHPLIRTSSDTMSADPSCP